MGTQFNITAVKFGSDATYYLTDINKVGAEYFSPDPDKAAVFDTMTEAKKTMRAVNRPSYLELVQVTRN